MLSLNIVCDNDTGVNFNDDSYLNAFSKIIHRAEVDIRQQYKRKERKKIIYTYKHVTASQL